jgi:hypothetical protein
MTIKAEIMQTVMIDIPASEAYLLVSRVDAA